MDHVAEVLRKKGNLMLGEATTPLAKNCCNGAAVSVAADSTDVNNLQAAKTNNKLTPSKLDTTP